MGIPAPLVQDHDAGHISGLRHLADTPANVRIFIMQEVAFIETTYAAQNGPPKQHKAASRVGNRLYDALIVLVAHLVTVHSFPEYPTKKWQGHASDKHVKQRGIPFAQVMHRSVESLYLWREQTNITI